VNDADGNDGPMTLEEWLDTKTLPDGMDDCKNGHVEHELVDGVYRIWAAHACANKKMILKFKWDAGTFSSAKISEGDKVKKVRPLNKGTKE
jgi:hypothetical protein